MSKKLRFLRQATQNNKVNNKPSIIKGWIKTFAVLFGAECLEELFESLIEEGIVAGMSWIFSNAITNVLFIFGIVQLLKMSTKQLTKILIIIIRPIIKKYTYKEGQDKVDKLKNLFTYLGNELATNPITICGIVVNGGIFTFLGLVLEKIISMNLPSWASILLAVLVCLVLFCATIFVYVKFVHEKAKDKVEREAIKANKKIVAEAKKQEKQLVKEATKTAELEKKKQEQATHNLLVKQKIEELKAKGQI